jgi:hypothetical protein
MATLDTPAPNSADRAASPLGRRRQRMRSDQSPPPAPWRVEGAPTAEGRRPNWLRLWWLFLVMSLVNWIVPSLLLSPSPRVEVS